MHFMICYPLKHVTAAMQFFKKRLYLHAIVYQHKKTVAVDSMLCDILCLTDPFLRLQSYSGEQFPISRAVLKSDFLMRLDDNVISLIEHSTDPKLEEARILCRRFRRHQFYKCAVDQPLDVDGDTGQSIDMFMDNADKEEILNSRRDILISAMNEREIQENILAVKNSCDSTESLDANDFIVRKYVMHHGCKDKNPLLCMRFFEEMNDKINGSVESLPIAKKINPQKYRSIIPSSFVRIGVRVFCRDPSKKAVVNQFFYQWFNNLGTEFLSSLNGGKCCPDKPTPTPKFRMDADNDSVDDDSMPEDNDNQHSIPLSQESFDDDDDESFDDQSPIPVHRRR